MASGKDVHQAKSCDGYGDRLGSNMYKLVIGPERRLFYCHEVILSQSPVLERMCNGPFKEGVEQQIELPDDDANAFGRVLEYMYRDAFDGAKSPNQDFKVAVLADVYILLEKYQLSGLKKLLTTRLGTFFNDASDAECIEFFFDAARKIYEYTPDSEALFPDYFKSTVTQMLACSDPQSYIVAHIKRCIFEGGKLAQDAFDAYFMHVHQTRGCQKVREKTKDFVFPSDLFD